MQKCDNHKKRNATKNVQLDWNVYNINKNGEYEQLAYSSGADALENYHFCEKCFEDWENGDLSL